MEDALALYAAQCFIPRINTAREAVHLCGANHERVTITALLKSTCEGLRRTLRGGGEAGLLLGVSSTSVLSDAPLQKGSTNRSFASRVQFRLAADQMAFPFGTAAYLMQANSEGKNSTRNW